MTKPLQKRIFLGLGLVCFVAGAVIFGIGLFSYFDGSSGRASDGESRIDPNSLNLPIAIPYYNPPPPAATEAAPPPAPPGVRVELMRLVIDKIEVNAPVVEMGLDAADVPEVPINGGDVAWYNFSALPGGGSNAVFAGHVTWNRGLAVFGKIDKLVEGDVIRLVSLDGRELVYKVYANFAVNPDDPPSVDANGNGSPDVMEPSADDIATLITCGGTWLPNPSERFGGEYTHRTIVQARLVSAPAAGG